MPHIITITEEIEEHGMCQQEPVFVKGEAYLLKVDGKLRLRLVQDVHFDRYVWEDVAQWTTTILEYFQEEYSLEPMPDGTSARVSIDGRPVGLLALPRENKK